MNSRKLIVLSKKQATSLVVDSLFKGKRTLSLDVHGLPYCAGKYKRGIIGEYCNVTHEETLHIYAIAKRDKDGTYYQLRSIVSPDNIN